MSSFRSRYLVRRQTVVTGKIRSVERYERFYDLTTDAAHRGTLPRMTLPAGQLLMRWMGALFNLDDARTIAPNGAMSVSNRFSGVRLDGLPGQGAVYLGTPSGSLREHAHYMQPTRLWHPGAADATAQFMLARRQGAPSDRIRFHLFRTRALLRLADLRTTSLMALMGSLKSSGESASRYGIVGHSPLDLQAAAPGEADDYSAARGMADAIWDTRGVTGHAGVCAFSARADSDSGLVTGHHGDASGGLVIALFGASGARLSVLAPAVAAPGASSFDTFADAVAAAG